MTNTPEDTTTASPEAGEVIAILAASAPRRFIGAAVLATLGLFLLYLVLWFPPASILWRLLLLAFGAFALFGCVRLWQATEVTLELTASELREKGTGRSLARVEDIREVSRGALAFKPSNGFSLVLTKPGERVWAPGIWWRMGRRVGVGGVTSSQQARFMAEMIAGLIIRRDN